MLVFAFNFVAAGGGYVGKKGNPPAIGVGLMRKLAKRFVVALTPEHYTSSIWHVGLP